VTIRQIAIKNLLRRKAKAGFILAGLIIGVATVVAVITFADTMTLDINHKLEKYGANILIVPRTDNLTLTYGGMAMGGVSFEMEPIREDQLAKIRQIKNAANIAAIGPMVLGGVRIQDRPALLAGVDMEAAAILKPWWKIDGNSPDENGLLIGSEAARILGLSQGRTIFLNQRKMSITGILSPTGSQDDDLIFTHLKTAQEILGKTGEVSLVEVAALCNACPIDEMVTQIAEQLPSSKVMAIQQVVKGRMETLSHFRKFSYGLSVVVVFIGGLVVLVTLMGSVKERTQEIGIFRAIGFRQSHIMRIIFLETGIISTSAGILGYLVGVGCIWAGLALFSHQVSPIPHLNPLIALVSVALALGVGLLAGLYPASMAARMDPNQALTTI
jgi:putative ABC transport system permease protein